MAVMNINKIIRGKGYSSKLKTQLILSFIIISFIILMLGSAAVYYGVLKMLENQREVSTIQRFRQAEYNIGVLKKDVDRVSKLLMVDDGLQEILGDEYIPEYDQSNLINSMYDKVRNIIDNFDYINSIYIFGENGLILGFTPTRLEYFTQPRVKTFLFNKDFYNEVKDKSPRLVWTSMFTPNDFNMQGYVYSNEQNERLITAARVVRDEGQSIVATIVINVNESKFTKVYNSIDDASTGEMYILDENGRIISARDKSMIWENSKAAGKIHENETLGSFTIESSEDRMQIVYLKLQDSGWYLVNEIPYKQYYRNISDLRLILISIFIVSMFLTLMLSVYWIYRLTRPLNFLAAAMKEMEAGKLGVYLDETPKNELGLVGKQFNKMSRSIMELIEKIKYVEERKRKYEVESLQAQINPHFLYNTLNTIKWMAYASNATNIADIITTLGNILQRVYKKHSVLCTIKEEVCYAENYIKIMNYRYGEGICFSFDIPEGIYEYMIPKFVFQPVIENSIVHGLADQGLALSIKINMHEVDNDIVIKVSDSGKGIMRERLEEIRECLNRFDDFEDNDTSIGLQNVNKRIKLHFGMAYGLFIDSLENVGTDVMIRIPRVKE